MKKTESFEKWLRETAQSADMKEVVAKAESTPLSDELLARYHAGLLSPEEEEFVAPLVALGEKNLRFLAEMEADIQHAAKRTEISGGLGARFADWAASFGAFWESPYQALRFAGTVATVALAAFLLWPAGPPDDSAAPYLSPLLAATRGVDETTSVLLSDGTTLGRFDLEWPLHRPVGDVDGVKWFTWSPLVERDAYDYRLYAPDGSILHQRMGLMEPHYKLPSSTRAQLRSGREYVWVVETSGYSELRVIRGLGRFTIVDR